MEVALGVLAGLVVGLAIGLLIARSRSRQDPPSGGPPMEAPLEPIGIRRLVDVMDPAAIVVDADDLVLLANASARGLGMVRADRISMPALVAAVSSARAAGSRRTEVALPEHVVGAGPRRVGVHATRLDPSGTVALLLQDVTEVRRVEEVRRDFVANVGHELKTPVGALTLLAEAVQEAADDPEAIRRFSARMRHEAERLARLVRELIDLSRLQGGDPLPALEPVPLDVIVAEAIDRTRLAAGAKGIQLTAAGQSDLIVRGVEPQLITALTNLLANAVAYSANETNVSVGTRARSGFAEIAITDDGVGIPDGDRQRVFERFYRVDQSRATATGGTGLGLAIVKHIVTNHGGSVEVWSEPGVGSTFTVRIPLAPQPDSVDLIAERELMS
ncbi:MAG: ATP-binding protein [Geodermatophilaceae bacterium]|nr:ATP-binding protein [Geodermatophilaceae bacterium]